MIHIYLTFRNAGGQTAHLAHLKFTFDVVRVPTDDAGKRVHLGNFRPGDGAEGRGNVGPGIEAIWKLGLNLEGSGRQIVREHDNRLRLHGELPYVDDDGERPPEQFCFELYKKLRGWKSDEWLPCDYSLDTE